MSESLSADMVIIGSEAVDNSLQHLTDADLRAIATYLKTAPARHDPADTRAVDAWGGASDEPDSLRGVAVPGDPDKMTGAQLYDGYCASCHQDRGQGSFDGGLPPLFHNTAIGRANPGNLVMVILDGIRWQPGGHGQLPAGANTACGWRSLASGIAGTTGVGGDGAGDHRVHLLVRPTRAANHTLGRSLKHRGCYRSIRVKLSDWENVIVTTFEDAIDGLAVRCLPVLVALMVAGPGRVMGQAVDAPEYLGLRHTDQGDPLRRPSRNRSIPGALKNAIDWASRPWGRKAEPRGATAVGTERRIA